MSNDTLPGKSFPLGATPDARGVNFCVYSKNATTVELLLFDSDVAAKPAQVIQLDPKRNRTGPYWHIFVPHLCHGQVYGYRVDGPFEPKMGHRFEPRKVLLDPYGKCVAVGNYSRKAAAEDANNVAAAMKSVVAESRRYDWEGDAPLCRPFSQTVI